MTGQNFFLTKPHRIYSEEFRQKVVREVLNGELKLCEASRKYKITGHSTISKWIKKYLIKNGKVENISYIEANNSVYMTESEKTEIELIKQENEKLKQELSFASMRVIALETMIDLAEKELKINLRKKCSTKLSKNSDKEVK